VLHFLQQLRAKFAHTEAGQGAPDRVKKINYPEFPDSSKEEVRRRYLNVAFL